MWVACMCVLCLFIEPGGVDSSILPTFNLVGFGQCWGVLSSCPHTSLLAARLQTDSHCCMSGQEGGSEGIPRTEIKDRITKKDREKKEYGLRMKETASF